MPPPLNPQVLHFLNLCKEAARQGVEQVVNHWQAVQQQKEAQGDTVAAELIAQMRELKISIKGLTQAVEDLEDTLIEDDEDDFEERPRKRKRGKKRRAHT